MAQQTFTLAELAQTLGAVVVGDPVRRISGLNTLQDAGDGELAFLANSRYLKQLRHTRAAAVLVTAAHQADCPCAALVVADPYLAYARISRCFAAEMPARPWLAPSAQVAADAEIDPSAEIGPNAVIGARTRIGAGAVIGANVVIGADCIIGAGSRLQANVTLYHDVKLGERCLIHSGAVLGADGFGFANHQGRWEKIAQLGGVTLGNDVEVGAGTTIDRGALQDTLIADGVKLDNQIQVAHNVQIGEDSAIAGCTAIAGSTKIGSRCTIAGAVGITGHLEIAAGSHITAMTLVSKSIREPGAYSSGTGVEAHQSWKKNVVRFRQLDEIARRLKAVETKIEKIEGHKE